jgi:hypothetical protein
MGYSSPLMCLSEQKTGRVCISCWWWRSSTHESIAEALPIHDMQFSSHKPSVRCFALRPALIHRILKYSFLKLARSVGGPLWYTEYWNTSSWRPHFLLEAHSAIQNIWNTFSLIPQILPYCRTHKFSSIYSRCLDRPNVRAMDLIFQQSDRIKNVAAGTI